MKRTQDEDYYCQSRQVFGDLSISQSVAPLTRNLDPGKNASNVFLFCFYSLLRRMIPFGAIGRSLDTLLS